MKNKLLFLLPILLISFAFISAQGLGENYQIKTQTAENYSVAQMTQAGNMFQYKYQYQLNLSEDCNCTMYEEQNQLRMEIREQKRFLFFNVEAVDNYGLNQAGEVIQARHNIWSRLLNRNKLEVTE